MFNAVLHATLQVMLFNYASFSNYWDWPNNAAYPLANVVVTSSGQDYIILPSVLAFGKEFFRCYSTGFRGVAVKYDSTKTYAYWDRKFIFFDILTVDHSINPVVTTFTIKMLNACGWYDALPEFGVHTNWGYQTGCDLVGTVPSALGCTLTTSEYSFALKQETCSMDYKSKGSVFSADTYFQMDGCPVFKKTSVYTNKSLDCTNMNRTLVSDTLSILTQEYFGPDSRCFVAKYKHINVQLQSADLVLLPVCQKFRCVASNGTMRLFVYLDNQAIECPQGADTAGASVNLGIDLQGTINCPPAEIFCRAVGNLDCRNNCGGNGICYQGNCVCYPGYFGDDCSTIGLGLNPLDVCIWPNTDPGCKIKPQGECYFFCLSFLMRISIWTCILIALSYNVV